MSVASALQVCVITAALLWHGHAAGADAAAGSPAFPIRPSGDGRYLVDAKGEPFLYHADTAWALLKKLTLKEAEEYLDDRKARGFTAVHVHAVSKEVGPVANREGHAPFEPLDDILKPNEAYWRHADAVLEAARRRGLLVAVSALWVRWGGNDREGWRGQLTEANARQYGLFLGRRYKHFDNIMWVVVGDADPKEKTGAVRALASALKEAAAHHLITAHNAPSHASAEFFNDDKWLDVNFAYTYAETPPHVLAEYKRKPVRPIVLGESGYEEESNDKRGGSAQRMRRQAYGAVLSGALGGHAFGQKHVWRFDEQWREALDSPATRHMTHLGGVLRSLRWHTLVPDGTEELVTRGRGKLGAEDFVSVARSADGSLALVYLPQSRAVRIDLGKLRGRVIGEWFDPTDGSRQAVAGLPLGDGAAVELLPPPKNRAGDSDFLLILKSE